MASGMKSCCTKISQKWIFAIMGFFSVFCIFAMRMCLPLTIPKMVKPIIHSKVFRDDSCPNLESNFHNSTITNQTVTKIHADTYEWDEYTQGIILGSFYWGFVASHLPGGMLAEKFGGKHTLGFGVLFTAICTILTPMSIVWGGSTALICLRIVMGICEGTTQPAISVMLAQWVPAGERSKITTFVFMGAMFGILLTSLLLGPLIRLMDWPGVYYIFGALGVIWYIFFMILCYNTPEEHPFISETEAKALKDKLSGHTHKDAPPVPWRHLLTSAPFWALVLVSVGRDWGGYTMMSDAPKYIMSVLRFTPEENGLLFLVMNAGLLLSCIIFSWLSDWLIKKNYMSITNVRKVAGTIGMTVHGIFGVLSSYVGCNKMQYFIVSFFSSLFGGAGFPGIKANVLDLSPNYAGTVMAISHGLAGLCGIAGPYVVGVLAPNQTLSEWRLIFWIIFVVTVVTNIIFVLFASGEVQEWNDPNFDRKKKKDKLQELQEVEKLLNQQKIQVVVTDVTN